MNDIQDLIARCTRYANDEDAEGSPILAETLRRCAAALAAQPEPAAQDREGADMFWNHDDPEVCQDSIFEVIDREWNGGMLKHGDVMEIQQAVRLPNIKVRLIPDGDGEDYFDFEVIDCAATKPHGGA